MRESAAKLRLVAVALAASGILIAWLLAVRRLIIQYLNILIIIIIISFLALRLETSRRYRCQPIVLPIGASAWAWCSIDVVVRTRCLTCCQIGSGTQSR